MGAALRVVDVVAEAHDFLMEFIDILERDFHFDLFEGAFVVDDVRDSLVILVDFLDEADDALGLVEGNLLLGALAAVFIDNRQLGIQIGRLVQAALHILFLEAGALENLRVRQKVDSRPGLSGLADDRQQTVYQLLYRHAPLEAVLADLAVLADGDGHALGKRVDDG